MNVLNTYEVADTTGLVFVWVAGILAVFMILLSTVQSDFKHVSQVLAGAAWFAFMAFILHANLEVTIRHEVTLQPGHVIDATKYEVVKSRGDIYVIEKIN